VSAGRLLACVAALLASTCGWSTGVTVPREYKSVGVEIFRNESYLYDLERDLHREMTRSVANLVDAPLEDPKRADLVVRGEIESYSRRGGVRSLDNRLLETGLTLRVHAELWDRGRNEILVGPIPASVSVGYTLDAPNTESEARSRALANIAQEIVLNLFTSPPPVPPTE
jgi:hypothetical protein